MKGIVITSKGVEDAASTEIKELIGSDCRIEKRCVVFEIKGFLDLCLLCYKSQSAERVLHLLGSFEFEKIEDIEKNIGSLELEGYTKDYKSFKVECLRIGEHDFNSVDVQTAISKVIHGKSGKSLKVVMKGQDLTFFACVVDNKCYFGVDFAGFELNKRQYKIFLHSGSLRGTIAYALVRESGFKKKETMLDPFSRDGVISIEAAMYASGFPVNYFNKEKFAFLKLKLGIDFEEFFKKIDRKISKKKLKIYSFDHLFKYVDYSKKNAKIAGVDKLVSFSRVELEWIDIKFKEESVDRIVTSLSTSKSINLDRVYGELFYQSEYILKKGGILAVITRLPEFARKHAGKHNFEIVKEKEIWSGEQQLAVILFKNR